MMLSFRRVIIYIGFLSFFFFSTIASEQDVEGHLYSSTPYIVDISITDGFLGTDFHFEDIENGIDIVVRKRKLRLFSQYEIYKNDGAYDARAYHRTKDYINPLARFSSMRSFRIQGADKSGLGRIEGTFFTTEAAKFNLYDRLGKHVAVAMVKKNGQEVHINDAMAQQTKGIATLKKNSITGDWQLRVTRPKVVDHRILKFLSVVIIDQFYIE